MVIEGQRDQRLDRLRGIAFPLKAVDDRVSNLNTAVRGRAAFEAAVADENAFFFTRTAQDEIPGTPPTVVGVLRKIVAHKGHHLFIISSVRPLDDLRVE